MRSPRVLVAPDKFKGSMTSRAAAAAFTRGIESVSPSATVTSCLISDGGEGMVDAALAAGGTRRTATVHGPLGAPVEAQWALLPDRRAVIELAQASGFALIQPTPATALAASTYGTGELIACALNAGVREIIIGVGGSASTDGGSGALCALGLKILSDASPIVSGGGGALRDAVAVDSAGLDPRLADTRLVLATDVRNPLVGPSGAAAVYGPQKGAGVREVAELDANLRRWAQLLAKQSGRSVEKEACAGAAGGFPSGFMALCGAETKSGFDVVAEFNGFETALAAADAVIIGEGSLDEQSLQGKAPIAIAQRAVRQGVTVLAVAGRVQVSGDKLRKAGVSHYRTLSDYAKNGADSVAHGEEYATRAAADVVAEWLADQR